MFVMYLLAALGVLLLLLRNVLRIPFADCDSLTAAAALPRDAYKGKVVWVTGASSGIGRELAVQLARQGAKLILSSRREAALLDVKAALGVADADVRVVALDLADLDALPAKAREAEGCFGRIDVLVNNGGVSTRDVCRNTTFAVDLRVMKVDFLSHAYLAKLVLPGMIERGGGLFINISSMAGKIGGPLRAAYSAAKFAIIGHFDALRAEEHAFGSGVRVCNVCPGSVRTEISRNAEMGDGSKFGRTDKAIAAGMSVERCADRVLAGAHAGLDELWIAQGRELFGIYMAQYMPTRFRGLVKKTARKYIDEFAEARPK